MQVVVSGLAGTGKGTFTKALAQEFGLPDFSIGDFVRAEAKHQGMTLPVFERALVSMPVFDRSVNDRVRAFAQEHVDFVIEGRRAQFLLPWVHSILLVCDNEVRYRRIAEREGKLLAQAREETQERERTLDLRYRDPERIGLPLHELLNPLRFNLVIDTTRRKVEESIGLARCFLLARR